MTQQNNNLTNLGSYSLEQLTEVISREAEAWEIKAGWFNKTWRFRECKKPFSEVFESEILPFYKGQNITIRAGAKNKNGDIINDGTAKTFHFTLPKAEEITEGETIYFDVMGSGQSNLPPNYPPNYPPGYPPNYPPFYPPYQQPQMPVILGGFGPQNRNNEALTPPQTEKSVSADDIQKLLNNALNEQRNFYDRKMLDMDYERKLDDLKRREDDYQKRLGEVEALKEEYEEKKKKFIPEFKDWGGTVLNGLFDVTKDFIKKNRNVAGEPKIETPVTKEEVKLGSKVTFNIPGNQEQKKEPVVEVPLSNKEKILKLLEGLPDHEFNEVVEGINKMIEPEEEQKEVIAPTVNNAAATETIEEKIINNATKNTTNNDNNS